MRNYNYIIATGIGETDLHTALMNMANLYADTGYTNRIELYKHTNKDLYLILFPNNPDFERFQFFVNYLKYPEDVKYNIDVRGYWTITTADKILSDKIGNRVMLYVSSNDTEFDNVQAVSENNTTYKLGFDGKVSQLGHNEKEFSEAKLNLDDFGHSIDIQPNPKEVKKMNKGCLLIGAFFAITSGLIVYLMK